MNNKVTAIALVVIAVALGIYQYGRQKEKAAATEDFPENAAYWLCQTCKKEFVTTIDDYLAHYQEHPGEALPCPDCGQSQSVMRLADSIENLRQGAAPSATADH